MTTHTERLLRKLVQVGGSDLHLAAGRPPMTRVDGQVRPIPGEAPLGDAELGPMLAELVSPDQWDAFEAAHDLDFACQFEQVGRFRGNYFVQEHGVAAVFRAIPERIHTAEELGLPDVVAGLADLEAGLVLVTGPTGSGKSTTLAAIIDRVNTRHARHIVTIEDPVEFVHDNRRSVVSQREVGTDTRSFEAALRSAVRQDADVVLVGELRDLETIALAINASSMGVLVFGTLHTASAAKTIDRIIDAFPGHQQPQARTTLAESLAAVVAQLLLPRADGRGRVAVHEILLRTGALPGLIREGKVAMLGSLIASSRGQGMQAMDDALLEALQRGAISARDAHMKAHDKRRFEHLADPSAQR